MILDAQPLLPTGRPVLVPGEVEIATLEQVDLEFDGDGGVPGDLAPVYEDGYVVLTSIKLVWVDNGVVRPACAVPLAAVQQSMLTHQGMAAMLRPSGQPKLKLMVALDEHGLPAVGGRGKVRVEKLKLVAHGKALESFSTMLERALREKAWSRTPTPVHSPLPSPTVDRVAQQPPQPPQPPPQPDADIVAKICSMGFSELHAAKAAIAVNNTTPHAAVEWLLEHQGDPDLDIPLPQPSPRQQPPPPSWPPQPSTWPPQPPPHPSASPATVADDTMVSDYVWVNPVNTPTQSSGASGYHPTSFYGAAQSTQPSWGAPPVQQPGYQVQPPADDKPLTTLKYAGVGGLMRKEAELAKQADSTMSQAFKDLSGLMHTAEEMVRLAEKFHAEMAKQRTAAPDGSSHGDESSDDVIMDWQMETDLINMGIAAPVTRDSAGQRYFAELARQLGIFLQAPLQRAGGMMMLTDVYCVFNRARGTELVSPDDLLQAVKMFGDVGVPLQLRTFRSGIMVVQSTSHSDDAVLAAIRNIVAAGDGCGMGVTANMAADALKLPVVIAAEQLLAAESVGILCRDDSVEGLRFYRNFFPLYVP